MTSYNPDQWQEAIAGLASAGITATNPSVSTDGAAIPASSTLIGASDGTNLQPLQVDGSKNLKVNIAAGSVTATNPSVGTDGSAIPTSSTLLGASDGTNLQPLQVDGSKYLKVNVAAGSITSTNPSVGTAGAAAPASDTLMGGTDGTNLRPVTVAVFHNADSQSLPSGSYGLLTGGIAQIVNASGTVDRQRGTGFDGVPAVGIATGAQQLAGPALTTTFSGALTGSANAQNAAVASTANLKVGDIVVTQDNVEYVEILTIVDATHANGIFKNNHANGQTLTWYHYNQARDASVGDAVALTGMGASATYLYNSVANTLELDRSANGELDGATGKGTAVAAEYEYNSGGPGGGNFDRARNLQGKGITTNTLNGAANNGQNQAILNTGAVPAVGQPVWLQGGTAEGAYVAAVAGQTLTFTANLANTHANGTNVQWDTYALNGPGTAGFLPTGVGIEEEALYDPVSGLFYIERSATQDGAAGANIVLENVALYNGSTFDRLRGDNTGAARTSLYVQKTTAGDTALALGQATMANSLPVALASNQGNVPANIAQINGSTLSLGQSTMANSMPVTLASNQGNIAANIAQWNGATIGNGNPVITQDLIRSYINAGQGFGSSTGKLVSGATVQTGFSLFNPNASGKNLIVYYARVGVASSSFHQMNLTTSDPALGTAPAILNMKPGGATAVGVASYSNAAVTTVGTVLDEEILVSNTSTDFLTNGAILVLPPNNGVILLIGTNTNGWFASIKWLEV